MTTSRTGSPPASPRPWYPRVRRLVDRWETAGGATVFTRFVNHPGSPYRRLINWTRMQTAPETTIVDELTAASSRARAIVDKPIYSLPATLARRPTTRAASSPAGSSGDDN